jgi:hypothetical protein
MEQAIPMGFDKPAMMKTREQHAAVLSLRLDLLLAELRLTRP